MSQSYLRLSDKLKEDEKPHIFTGDYLKEKFPTPSMPERILISFGTTLYRESYLEKHPDAKAFKVKYDDFFDKSTKKMKDPKEIYLPLTLQIIPAWSTRSVVKDGLVSLHDYMTYVMGKAGRRTKIKIIGHCNRGLDSLGDTTSYALDMTESYRSSISYDVKQVAEVIRAISDDSVSQEPTEDKPSMLKISLLACLSAKDSFPQKNNSFAERLATHLYMGESPVYCSITGANKLISVVKAKHKYYGGDYGLYMKTLTTMVSFLINTRIGIPLIIIPCIAIVLYAVVITAEGYIHKQKNPNPKTGKPSNALRKTVFFPAKEQDGKSTQLVVKKTPKPEYDQSTVVRNLNRSH